ncbi:MAG: MFS transporter [Hyphomonadaceae bacterium]|nr:MFS transporter [Hyphomonadaceae bacterium]
MSDLLSGGYRARFLAVMLLVNTFNFADRAIFSALGQAVKQDLLLTDTQLGLLQGFSFALLYAVAGIPIGRLAERGSRVGIIAVAVTVWSGMTAACGLAMNFWHMMLARIGVGIGEAGFSPPSSSLVSDHFGSDRRASALAIIALGSPLGALVGAVGGGLIAGEHGWRIAFFALGAPGLLLGLIVFLLLKEPQRGLADGVLASEPPPPMSRVLAALMAKPTFVHVVIGGAAAGLGMNAIGHFLAPFLGRVHALDIRSAALWFGLVSSASLAIGLLIGGLGTDRLARHDRRWSAWGPAIGLALAAPLYYLGFQQAELLPALAFIFGGAIALISHYGPLLGIVQNLAPPRARASAAALVGLVFAIFGVGLGPTLVGILSDHFATQSFGEGFAAACPGGRAPAGASELFQANCASASAAGMRTAFSVMVLAFPWAALHFLIASFTLRRDLHTA